MNIQHIVDLWNKSKYDTLIIKGMPCVNHKGEITYGTGVYTKNQTILCGGKIPVYNYLLKIYDGSIFVMEEVAPIEDYICFKMIMKG